MRCRTVQSRLTQSADTTKELRTHLATCDDCQRFAERAAQARRMLRQHDHEHTPDAGFSARVLQHLPSREGSAPDALGWAAWRLLPAALVLLFALGSWSLFASPSPSDLLAESTSQDILAWVIDTTETTPEMTPEMMTGTTP